MPQPSPRDRMTGLEFASVASADPNANVPAAGDACWTRLDGVWKEDRNPTFDTLANDGSEWDVQGLPLAGLLHGNYTTPEGLFIAPGDDTENELYVMSGINDVRMTRYVSSDGLSVAGLIGQAGTNKVYEAQEQTSLSQRLSIDYTAGGALRIRLGNRQFLRPQTTASRDLPSDDVFAIQFQTDNFAANLKGYNVLTQDPFLLMNNTMREVFDRRDPDEYRIQEKYAVPFGFTLQNELLQGNVYRSTTVSSAKEMQDANSTSFGVNANISVSGAVNTFLSFKPGRSEIADTGASVGYSSTQSTMNSMRQSNTVAQVVGYSRAKSYAIIVDHSESKLSSGFLTAVGDAQREGRYQDLINQFGTHYAYAVTYGASAKMTRDISSEAFESVLSETEGDKLEGEVRILGSSIGGFNESMTSRVEGYSGAFGNEGGRFISVGGNGSWDSGGYSRGDRVAPILLDLRPLDELLNPINFPDQPDIYTRVRAELALAINQYLAGQSRPLSSERPISKVSYTPPAPEPEPEAGIEEWHVYVRTIGCTKPGPGTTTAASGDIRISGSGHTNAFAGSKELSTGCKWKDNQSRTYDYRISDNTPGLMIVRGTREQMRNYTLNFDFNWRYKGAARGRVRSDKRSLNNTPMQRSGLAVGKSHTTQWKVGPKGRPEITLHLRVKRIK
ncbi:MAG: MAC/perforin domain-containing protein [Erythrobacter sp.]